MSEYVSRHDAAAALGPRLAQFLPAGDELEVVVVPASDLLVPRRLDVAVKALHVGWARRGIDSDFARKLYLEHLRVFNGFVEADGSGKLGVEEFCGRFRALAASVAAHGLRKDMLIPVSGDGVILDGAHRVALCLQAGFPVRTVRTTVDVGPTYDASYFEARGMKRPYLDAAIVSYISHAPDTRLVLVWPTAAGRDAELSAVINRHAAVVARKDVPLSTNAAVNLVVRAYQHESWLGGPSDDYAGGRNKARWCTDGDGPLRVFVVHAGEDLLTLKEEIRAVFGNGKHSVHINDTHQETVELAGLLFNANSLHNLHFGPPTSPKWFRRLFDHYDAWLSEFPPDEQDLFCIDGSSVLAAYGVRDVRDLDFLYAGAAEVDTGFKEIGLHNHVAPLYGRSIDSLVHDPTAYFYFRGRKMLAAPLVSDMKTRRGEAKDVEDVASLAAVLRGTPPTVPRLTSLRRNLTPARLKGRAKLVALKARYHLLRWKRQVGRTGSQR